MKKFLLPLILLVMAFSVSCDDSGDDGSNDDVTYLIQFREGFEPDTSYDQVSDTMISSSNPGDNYGTNAKMFVWADPEWRSLVKFNIAGYVPPSAVITRAVLSFYSDNIIGPLTINVHAFYISWYEGTATWNHSGGQAWTGGEGNYDEEPIASKRVSDSGASLQEVSFNLDPGAVQEWIDNPWSNQGVALIAVDETTEFKGADFITNDSSYDYLRPVLTIEFKL